MWGNFVNKVLHEVGKETRSLQLSNSPGNVTDLIVNTVC